MAYEFGNATGFDDLFDKLIDFLTTNPDLVLAGQAWTLLQVVGVNTHSLRAPGSGGESDIYLHFFLNRDLDAPYFNLCMRGSVGYEAGQNSGSQPFVTSYYHQMLCWDQPMPYWFFADGRHLKAFVKVSTTYQSLFGGLILPNGTAAEMPYPMYVAGTASSFTATTANHTAASYNYASFFDPSGYGEFRASDNIWRPVRNHYDSSGSYINDNSGLCIWPWMGASNETGNFRGMRECFNGGAAGGPYPIWQAQLVATSTQAGPNIHGYLPGVFWVPGFSQAPENIIQIGGDDYLVMQSHRWSHRNAFCAIKVE